MGSNPSAHQQMSGSKNYDIFTQGILCSREKEGAYTLCNSMDGTGELMLSEISQRVRDKYHMISPLTEKPLSRKKSKVV